MQVLSRQVFGRARYGQSPGRWVWRGWPRGNSKATSPGVAESECPGAGDRPQGAVWISGAASPLLPGSFSGDQEGGMGVLRGYNGRLVGRDDYDRRK